MGVYPWYLTKRREALIAELVNIPDDAGKNLSQVMEEALADHIKRKLKTHNPQTVIPDFEDPAFRALPNLWLIDAQGDVDKLDTDELRQVQQKAQQVEYLARRRLEARGER